MPKGSWRQVVHIEEREPNRKGDGGTWWLTLECGHFTARSRPRPTFARTVGLILGRQKIPSGFAPERVRCVACPVGEPT